MNADNQRILFVEAGHVAPKDMLEYCLGKKPNAVGFMVQEPDGAPLVMHQEDATGLEIGQIETFLSNAKARPKAIYFGKLADGYNPEDIQPFYVEDGDKQKLIGLMFEGDLATVFDDKSHTEQYNYVHQVLFPKIVQWCEDNEGDIPAVMKMMEREAFKKTFLASIGHRAVLHVMPHIGPPLMLSKNQLFQKFDWGWVSHAEGYGAKAAEPAKVIKPAAGYGWGGNKTPKANADKPTLSVPSKVQDAATPGTAPRSSVPASSKKPTEGSAIKEQMAVRPPSWLHRNEDIQSFYLILTGEKHPQWKKRLPIIPTQNLEVLEFTSEKQFQDYAKRWKMERALKTTGDAAVSSAPQTKADRLASTAAPGNPPPLPENPPAEQPVHGPVDPSPLPIIEPDKLEKVLDFITKYLDPSSKEMGDPTTIQDVEKKIEPFTSQVGLKGLEETMNWPVNGLFGLAATDARAIVLYALQWRNYGRPYLLAELKAKKKDGVQMTTETTVTDLGNGSKKTESVVKPAAKPAKAMSWGFGNKKVA